MKRGTNKSPGSGLLCVVLVFSFALVALKSAAAQEAESSSSAEEQKRLEARELYKKGKEFYDNAQYEKALVEFEAAYSAQPHPVVLKSIAECNVMLNRIPEAIDALEKFLQNEGDKGGREVEQRIEELRRLLATLEVKSEPIGAKITLDGKETGQTTPCVLEVGPGSHEVVLVVDDFEPLTKTVSVDSGQSNTVEANFSMEGTPLQQVPGTLISPFEDEDEEDIAAKSAKDGPPAGFWVCAALVGVGLVGGTVFGTMALNSEDDYKKNHDPESKEAGEREAIIADVSFGVALASAVVGTIVLLTYDKGEKEEELVQQRDRTRIRVSGMPGRDTVGVSAAITF